MIRVKRYITSSLILCAIALAQWCRATRLSADSPPNIVFIFVDDMDESVTEVGWIHGENAAKIDRLAVI